MLILDSDVSKYLKKKAKFLSSLLGLINPEELIVCLTYWD